MPIHEVKVVTCKEATDKAIWLGVVMTDLRESTVCKLCRMTWQ